MFNAFTTRRLSQDGDQGTPLKLNRPCLPAALSIHSARKPPLCKKLRAGSPDVKPHGGRQAVGRVMEQFTDLRLLGSALGPTSGADWHCNSLRFGRELIGTAEQEAGVLLRKRRRSLGGRIQQAGTGPAQRREAEEGTSGRESTKARSDQQHFRHFVMCQLDSNHADNSRGSRAVRNPFATPRKVKKHEGRTLSAGWKGLEERAPNTKLLPESSGPARLNLGGAVVGNADEVDVAGLSGLLQPDERVAWQAFAPLQRVLIVAVAAAATANLQRQDGEERDRLKRAVEARDHALALMRQQMGHLLGAQREPPAHQHQEDSTSTAPPAAVPAEQTPQMAAGKPPVQASSTDLSLGSISFATFSPGPPSRPRCTSPAPVSKKGPSHQGGQHGRTESHPGPGAVLHSTRKQEGPTNLSASFESVVARAVLSGGHALTESLESVKGGQQSGTKAREAGSVQRKPKVPSSPPPSSGGLCEVDPNLVHLRNRAPPAGHKEDDPAARCAAAIAEAKEAAVAVLNREAAAVLAALVIVVRKAGELEGAHQKMAPEEGHDGEASRPAQPSSVSAVGANLRTAVEGATSRIVSLQKAVSDTWHSLGPAALAALQRTAPEGNQPPKCADTSNGCTTPRRSLQSCRGDLLRLSLGSSCSGPGTTPLNRSLESLGPAPRSVHRKWAGGDPHSGRQAVESGPQLSSMVDTAVQRAVEKMMKQDEGETEDGGSERRQSRAGQELVAELERAAAKMAGMEAQLAALQDELRASTVSRHHLEAELEAVNERDFRTQTRLEQETRGLVSELALRDSAIGELRRSHAVVVAAKDRELRAKRQQVADLHAELEEAEALLGLAGLGSGEAEHVAGEREREGCDKDSTIQALEEQVRQLQGQVVAQELQLDQLRRPPLHSAPDSMKETKLGVIRRLVDDLPGTFGFGALDKVPLVSSCPSVLRSSTGSSDVLLDTMSEYSQEYHLTDQAIADMLHSVGSPDRRRSVGSPGRRRGVNGVGAGGGRYVGKSYHKARLSVDSILSRKSLFEDASGAGKGEEGANKKRRWI